MSKYLKCYYSSVTFLDNKEYNNHNLYLDSRRILLIVCNSQKDTLNNYQPLSIFLLDVDSYHQKKSAGFVETD